MTVQRRKQDLSFFREGKSMDMKCICLLKKIFRFIVLVFGFMYCSTYRENRKNDIQDILTLGFEKESYGFGIRTSFLPIGFFFQSKEDLTKGYGLRGGSFGEYSTNQLVFGFLGGESFYHGELLKDANGKPIKIDGEFLVANKRDNLKSHSLKYLHFYKDPPSQRRKRQREKDLQKIAQEISETTGSPGLLEQLPKLKPKQNGYTNHYLYQVEIFIGIHYGLRLGFNIAEFVDGILGFLNIDILEDDIQGELNLQDYDPSSKLN